MASHGPLDRVITALRSGGDKNGGGIAASDTASGDDFARVLADSIAEAILQVDGVGRVRGVNHAACTLFGISSYPPPPGQMIGQTVLEATHLRVLADLCADVLSTRKTSETPDEFKMVGRGTEKRIRALATPTGGGVLLVLSDQTELFRLRTVRTEFVANVSHELRTPLASIRATAETLMDGAINDEPEVAQRFLETIIREADRLVRLSDDLLGLARAESTEPIQAQFDVRVLLADVSARLSLHAERRNIRLHLPPSGEPVLLSADRSEIDQVLFNLLDNAIKYTPEGGRVTVTLTSRPDVGKVEIVFADTGIGILSQDLPRIFERFWRADRARRFQNNSDSGRAGGTGLGLSIVKHIVEAHGGVVRAESELGQGARFIVALPLSPDPAANVPRDAPTP